MALMVLDHIERARTSEVKREHVIQVGAQLFQRRTPIHQARGLRRRGVYAAVARQPDYQMDLLAHHLTTLSASSRLRPTRYGDGGYSRGLEPTRSGSHGIDGSWWLVTSRSATITEQYA